MAPSILPASGRTQPWPDRPASTRAAVRSVQSGGVVAVELRRPLRRRPGELLHPVLDESALQALFTPAGQRTAEQAVRVALDDALIAELQAADVVVLGCRCTTSVCPHR